MFFLKNHHEALQRKPSIITSSFGSGISKPQGQNQKPHVSVFAFPQPFQTKKETRFRKRNIKTEKKEQRTILKRQKIKPGGFGAQEELPKAAGLLGSVMAKAVKAFEAGAVGKAQAGGRKVALGVFAWLVQPQHQLSPNTALGVFAGRFGLWRSSWVGLVVSPAQLWLPFAYEERG